MEKIKKNETAEIKKNNIQPEDLTINNVNQNEDFLERTRLHALLEKAINYPLVILCAGSGYGKTRAVRSFLDINNAISPWLPISERDNIPLRLWESLCQMSLKVSEEYSSVLKEIGFPKTNEAFKKFGDAIKNYIGTQSKKVIGIFDDFHLLHNSEVFSVFEHIVNTAPSNLSIILITRSMPEINLVGMNMNGKAFIIQEEELKFTEDEITKYFSQLNLPVTNVDTRNIYDDTQGWAFAINLIGRSLAKNQKYERYALEAMKKNIFRLIEAELCQTISEPLKNFLMRISLLERLPANLIKALANDDELISEMERLNAYIRYDFNMDSYMIHHMFRDFLRHKQEIILTDEERIIVYEAKAAWCDENGYPLDAFHYYEKAANYDAIINKVAVDSEQIMPDTAKYILDIFERILKVSKPNHPLFPSMHIRLVTNTGQYDEAMTLAKQYIKDYEALPDTPERNRTITTVYLSWIALWMYTCTFNDVYNFDIYAVKMREYFDKSPFKFVGTYKQTSAVWSILVGTDRAGAIEEFIAAVSRATPNIMHVLNGFFAGLEDLLWGELYIYQRRFNDAEQYLYKAIVKANEYDQYVTHSLALYYLMLINFFRGDITGATARLKEIETLLCEKENGVHYTLYNIFCGFYYILLDMPEKIPEWLKGDFSPYKSSAFLEISANRVRMRYHYKTAQYGALLAYIENAMKHPMILFGRIELLILKSLSLYKLKKRDEAIAAFNEAYRLSESNKIIASFTEYAKDMRTLTLAVQKDKHCMIQKKWLEEANRISSTYAKLQTKIIGEYNAANNINNEVELTKRETAILKNLADGLSRSEIAASRGISINTTKMAINLIYGKLGVSSLPEAIRAAIDKKII